MRDLLPLPTGAVLRSWLRQAGPPGLTRGSRLLPAQEQWLLQGVEALNAMTCVVAPVPADKRPSLVQQMAVSFLSSQYAGIPTAEDPGDDLQAWISMQGVAPGYGSDDQPAGSHVTYQPGKLSLPSGQAGAVELLEVRPPDLHEMLVSGHGLLRQESEAQRLLKDDGVPVALDVKLAKKGHDFGAFIGELFDKGIIELGNRDRVKENVGACCVARKDDKLRLIFDTRRANMWFQPAPHTCLCSGEAFGDLELQGVGSLHARQGDVEVCFYQYGMPEWIKPYFALEEISVKFLPWPVRRKLQLWDDGASVVFWCRVLPMGWAWAVHLVQSLHLHIFEQHHIIDQWVLDRHPAGALTPGVTLGGSSTSTILPCSVTLRKLRTARST